LRSRGLAAEKRKKTELYTTEKSCARRFTQSPNEARDGLRTVREQRQKGGLAGRNRAHEVWEQKDCRGMMKQALEKNS